jgi:hypothetical protein
MKDESKAKEEIFLWQDFINGVVLLYGQGFSDSEMSLHFFGAFIEGEGVVVESKLSEEYAPGIVLEMRPETVQLPKKNKVLRCDHLFLIIEPDSNRKWMGCSIGEKIRFRARIPGNNGPFSAIRLSEYDEEPEIPLMVKLRECELL